MYVRQGVEDLLGPRHEDHIVSLGKDLTVALQDHSQDLGTAGLDLFDVAHHLVEQGLIAGQGDHRTTFFNQGNGPVL